jgi:hypothetical protein
MACVATATVAGGMDRSAESAPATVVLHPAVGDTLDAREAARFGLFGGVRDLRWVVFVPAPWGGYLARIQAVTDTGVVIRERNVSSQTWRTLRDRVEDVLAGRPPVELEPESLLFGPFTDPFPGPPAPEPVLAPPDSSGAALQELPDESTEQLRVWPEAPLPAILSRRALADSVAMGYPRISGRWFVMLEAGYKHNISDFREYFTDQGLFAVSWGRMFGRVMPFLAIEVGFGDIRKQFEEISGDGRANTYNFSLGLQLRQPMSKRTHVYVSAAYGYFIRSLNWGGIFVNPERGTVTDGYVLEQQDWGRSFRLGVQFWRKGRPKPRFWDVGIGYQTSRADAWNFVDDLDNPTRFLSADGNDTWLILSVRFGDAI